VRTLLERGADPNIRDEGDSAFPIHFAAERGDLAVVKLLVEHGADPIGAETAHGRLPAARRESIRDHQCHGTHRLCGARRSRLVIERLLLNGLDEVQLVAIQVADAELSGTVEHVLDILLELDSFVCDSLTGKRSVRR
jgi:ankyrin repeat protein